MKHMMDLTGQSDLLQRFSQLFAHLSHLLRLPVHFPPLVGLLILGGSIMSAGLSSPVHAEKIYRTIDENGNVVFSDLPPTNAVEAQRDAMEVESPNTYESSGAVPETPFTQEPAATETKSSYYQYLEVLQPAQDETIRDNAGNVTIVASVQPELRKGNALQLIMDGAVSAAQAEGTSIILGNVDRGTHTINLQVVDRSGNVLIQSEPVTFHLLRFSALHNPNTN